MPNTIILLNYNAITDRYLMVHDSSWSCTDQSQLGLAWLGLAW
ncbi:hypothetical protein [Moraxella lacunata]|nr:hypothetical protein [Moraxella lacunata]